MDAGVYLDAAWMPNLGIVGNRVITEAGHPAILLRWPDMGVPDNDRLALATTWARDYLERGKGVEVACIGGHGRTGTFIACILREYGFSAKGAIAVVRKKVCKHCIEAQKQEELIASWPRGEVR